MPVRTDNGSSGMVSPSLWDLSHSRYNPRPSSHPIPFADFSLGSSGLDCPPLSPTTLTYLVSYIPSSPTFDSVPANIPHLTTPSINPNVAKQTFVFATPSQTVAHHLLPHSLATPGLSSSPSRCFYSPTVNPWTDTPLSRWHTSGSQAPL